MTGTVDMEAECMGSKGAPLAPSAANDSDWSNRTYLSEGRMLVEIRCGSVQVALSLLGFCGLLDPTSTGSAARHKDSGSLPVISGWGRSMTVMTSSRLLCSTSFNPCPALELLLLLKLLLVLQSVRCAPPPESWGHSCFNTDDLLRALALASAASSAFSLASFQALILTFSKFCFCRHAAPASTRSDSFTLSLGLSVCFSFWTAWLASPWGPQANSCWQACKIFPLDSTPSQMQDYSTV